MIINKGVINNSHEYSKYMFERRTYYLSGLIYKDDVVEGEATIIAIEEEYEETGKLCFRDIKGAFVLIVVDESKTLVFTDNSNMRCLYYRGDKISDSFLEIATSTENNEFDIDAICEFLVLGAPYFGKTLIKNICVTQSINYYVLESNKIKVENKEIGDIEYPGSVNDPNVFFDNLAGAIKERKATLSLTGGYDSRMIFATLKNKIKVNPFISGDNMKDPDIVVAGKTANAGDEEVEVVLVPKPKVNDKIIEELFSFGDGLELMFTSSKIRKMGFIKDRVNKGFDLYISGDGGPRHKDWNWIQDFPFYKRSKTNIIRYYYQNVEIIKEQNEWLSEKMKVKYNNLAPSFCKQLKKYAKKTNTESYDSFGFETLSDFMKIGMNNISRYINMYAPLWELDLVRYSYALPRKERFFCNYMRRVTTNGDKNVARVNTVYHTSSSSELKYKIKDVIGFMFQYIERGTRYLGRKILKRTLFVGKVQTWEIESQLCNLQIIEKALEYCIEKDLICSNINKNGISKENLMKILHIYMLGKVSNI